MAWVDPATFSVGQLADEDDLNQALRDNMNALHDPPRVRLGNSADTNVSGEFKELSWSGINSVHSGNLWTAGEPTQIQPSIDGNYALSLALQFATAGGNTTTIVYSAILQNDAAHLAIEQHSSDIVGAFNWLMHCATIVPLTTTDNISAWVFESGGTVTVDSLATGSFPVPAMCAWWVGE